MPLLIKLSICTLIFLSVQCADPRINVQNGNNAIQVDPCDDPDARISCCFANMPSNVTHQMIITESEDDGEILLISGRVINNIDSGAMPNILIYGYHTDKNGYYTKAGTESGVQKWHGKFHGWCKTNDQGEFEIRTIRPAPYPDNTIPAHIHLAIQKPHNSKPFYINDIVFSEDPLTNEQYRSSEPYEDGGSGIIDLKKRDSVWKGERLIILSEQ
ncbi:MAG: hypothetical protein HKN22_05670 [Bacteroidia bacterium]|nr:hypothetical protein [Bacteroidia bacterium]